MSPVRVLLASDETLKAKIWELQDVLARQDRVVCALRRQARRLDRDLAAARDSAKVRGRKIAEINERRVRVSQHCTTKCEAMPLCLVCHRTKKPHGRSAPLEMANGLCDFECPGYSEEPKAGHLWPGELERSKADES